MVDQVSPTGSLAPGLPQAAVANRPQPGPETNPSARPVVSPPPPPAQGRAPGVNNGTSPEEAVKQINNYLQSAPSDLKMEIDKASGRTVFQVISANTGEVLLQVPSVEVLAMARKLTELAKQKGAVGVPGVLVDKEG